jgi:hypothetical protein
MKIRELVGADLSITPRTWLSAPELPTISTLTWLERSLSSATSLRSFVASIARWVISSSRSILNGFSM